MQQNQEKISYLSGAKDRVSKAKGMVMQEIHPDYKSKKIISFVKSLILDSGCDHYHQIEYSSKLRLAALLNETCSLADGFNCLTDNAFADALLQSFRNSLIFGTPLEDKNFVNRAKLCACEYYETIMEELFNMVLNDYNLEVDSFIRAGEIS